MDEDDLFNDEERETQEQQMDEEHDLLLREELWMEEHDMLHHEEDWIQEDGMLNEEEWIEEYVFFDEEEWEEERRIDHSYHRALQLQEHRERQYQMLLAASAGSLDDLIKYQRLLEYSIPNALDTTHDKQWGYTVLHLASKDAQLHIVKYLIEECNIKYDTIGNNKEQSTALQVASSYGRLPIVEYFINNCNADINEADLYGNTLLHRAIRNGRVDVVRYLTQDCGDRIDIERKNNHGLTALHFAVMFSKLNIVQFLATECKVNIEVKSAHVWTPLHIAVFCCSKMTTVQYLIDTCHVDITAMNYHGQSIFDILFYLYCKRPNATDYCNDIVVRILQTLGLLNKKKQQHVCHKNNKNKPTKRKLNI
jgi:ankyrin repeat protein